MAKIGVLTPEEAGKRAKAKVARWDADEKRRKAERGAAARRAAARSAPVGEIGRRRQAAEFARHKLEPEGIAKGPEAGTELDLGSATITQQMRKILSVDERERIDAELIRAVGNGDLGAVERLLDAGADPDAKAADGRTVLIIATWAGFVEIAEMLKKKGADTKAKDADGLQAIVRGPGGQVGGMREVADKGGGKQ